MKRVVIHADAKACASKDLMIGGEARHRGNGLEVERLILLLSGGKELTAATVSQFVSVETHELLSGAISENI
jgi:hypothetical protein